MSYGIREMLPAAEYDVLAFSASQSSLLSTPGSRKRGIIASLYKTIEPSGMLSIISPPPPPSSCMSHVYPVRIHRRSSTSCVSFVWRGGRSLSSDDRDHCCCAERFCPSFTSPCLVLCMRGKPHVHLCVSLRLVWPFSCLRLSVVHPFCFRPACLFFLSLPLAMNGSMLGFHVWVSMYGLLCMGLHSCASVFGIPLLGFPFFGVSISLVSIHGPPFVCGLPFVYGFPLMYFLLIRLACYGLVLLHSAPI